MNFLWYCKGTSKTGKKLAQALNIPCGKRLPDEASKVVCWGAKCNDYIEDVEFLNPPNHIATNRDKFNALAIMRGEGVSVPDFCMKECIDEMIELGEMSFPVVGRIKSHQGGKGIFLCRDEDDLERVFHKVHHFTQFIEADEEFRVHVFGDRIIKVARKVKEREGSDWIKNDKNGFSFKKVLVKRTPKIVKLMARKAVEAIPLDFGAVDVLYKDGKAYVLEVNTAPSLNSINLELYRKNIQEWLDEL